MAEDWAGIALKQGFETEKDMWQELYIKRQMPLRWIGKLLGVSGVAVRYRLVLCKVPLRKQGGDTMSEKVQNKKIKWKQTLQGDYYGNVAR